MRALTSVAVVVSLALAVLFANQMAASAQEGRERGERRDRERGPQRWDPARMMDMFLERLQDDMDTTDEEWEILEPRMRTVLSKQMEQRTSGLSGGGRGMMGGRRGGDDANRAPEVVALSDALDEEDTSAEDLKAKMEALREARAQAEDELDKARDDLREVLSLRQEARLVLAGILD